MLRQGRVPDWFAGSASTGAAAPGAGGMRSGCALLSPPPFPHTAGTALLPAGSPFDLDQLCMVGPCSVNPSKTPSGVMSQQLLGMHVLVTGIKGKWLEENTSEAHDGSGERGQKGWGRGYKRDQGKWCGTEGTKEVTEEGTTIG